MKEDPRKRGAARIPSRGPELLGGVLFLIGCLPAVALIKAVRDGTDLSSAGLGGTAALAARVETWVGTWPGLMISGAIAVFGAMAVLGALRSDLMRRMVGIVVCGLGVAAISSALAVGSGGRIGDGTGARLADAVGPWAGILVGAGIVAVALWLAFAEAPREGSRTLEVSLDGPELRRASAERSGPAVQEISPPSRGGQSSSRPASKSPGSGSSAPRGAGGKAKGGEAAGGPEESVGAASRRPKPSQATGGRPAASSGVAPEAASEAVTPARPSAEQVPAADPASPASTGAGMPLLDREADPVVDGPSPSAQAGGFSFAAIPSWLGGLVGAVSGRLMSRRPRVAMPAPKKSEPKTLGDALVRGEAEGVSHDEAAALAPDGNTLAYMEEVWRDASASLQQVEPIPPSPYPDDPRLKGEIPQGTTPLGGAAAAGPAPPAAEVVPPAPSAELTTPIGDVAPFDLVDDEESLGLGGEGGLAPGSVGDGAAAPEASVTDLPSGVAPLESDVDELSLPRPPASWEGGFEGDTVSEADGTWTRGGTAEDPAVPTAGPGSGDEPEGGALAHGEEAQAADSPEDSLEGEAPADEISAEEEEPEEEPEEESDEYEYVDEDGNPIDIDALEDGDYELVDEDDYEAAELDEEEEEEEEEEGDEEEPDEEEEAEYEEAEYEEAAEDESPQEDPAEDPEEDLEEDEAAAELEDADPDEYEEALEEEAVILEPQSPPSGASADSERLLKAGRVLVRQGRVAVSVLQQELDMEFDEACQLLDQLQAEGLIGPYKGGKKRDILLSEEEWEDHFAHS